MIPANKVKEIRETIDYNDVGGDSDGIPPILPILILVAFLIVGMLFLLVII